MTTREGMEDYLISMWRELKVPDNATPVHFDDLLTKCIGLLPYIAEMEIVAGKAWFEKSKEIEPTFENKSQFDKAKKVMDEYYIYKLICNSCERLSDFKTSLQSKLKSYRQEFQDSNKY